MVRAKAFSFLLVLVLLASACNSEASPSLGLELSPPRDGSIPLPSELDQGMRTLSFTTTITSANLAQDLSRGTMEIEGDVVNFTAPAGDISYGVFAVGGLGPDNQPQHLELNLAGSGVPLWLAWADFGLNRWQWQRVDLTNQLLQYDLPAGQLFSPATGNFYLVLVAADGNLLSMKGGFLTTSGSPPLTLPPIPGIDVPEDPASADRLPATTQPVELLSNPPMVISAPTDRWETQVLPILPDYQSAVSQVSFDIEWSGSGSYQVGMANYQTGQWEMVEPSTGGTHTFTPRPISSYHSWDDGSTEDDMAYLIFAVPPGETLTVNSIQITQAWLAGYLPPGFEMNKYLELSGARDIWTDQRTGVTYVMRRVGNPWEVWWLKDENGDGVIEPGSEVGVITGDVSAPGNQAHGVTVYGNEADGFYLYAGVYDTIYRIKLSADGRSAAGPLEEWVTGLPSEGGHNAKSIRFDADGNAYIGVGSIGNISTEQHRAAIYKVGAGDNTPVIWVNGIRNPTALLVDGSDLVVFSVERDLMGDDFPVEPMFRLPLSTTSGTVHLGYPWWVWDAGTESYIRDARVSDPPTPPSPDQIPFTPEAWIPAHNTPLGMVKAELTNFPSPWNQGIFVAARGSWNSSVRTGYRVFLISGPGMGTPFTGKFLTADPSLPQEEVGGWFRPVSCAVAPDGSLLVTGDRTTGPVSGGDGFTGVMRISYQPESSLNLDQ